MTQNKRRAVIIGGGFAGLAVARHLDTTRFDVTLIDQRNFHLFQPLLYQVATGSLGATDIAAPLRMILRSRPVQVLMAEVDTLDLAGRSVSSGGRHLADWDVLVLAMGLGPSYFGHDAWAQRAPGLKYIEDAFRIRTQVLAALERAELTTQIDARARELTFVIVGGGPTGVELAGALGELTGRTLARQFRRFDPRGAEILLIEAGPRILPQYPEQSAVSAMRDLSALGVTVHVDTKIEAIDGDGVAVVDRSGTHRVATRNVIWAAGTQATASTRRMTEPLAAAQGPGGRLVVDADFRLSGREDVFVVGDLAHYQYQGRSLPGLAPAAAQAGRHVANYLNGERRVFVYRNVGQLAVIGRNAAVGLIGTRRVSGRVAWWLWLFVHIRDLIGFDTKLKVMIAWTWKFLYDKYEARLIFRDLTIAVDRTEGADAAIASAHQGQPPA